MKGYKKSTNNNSKKASSKKMSRGTKITKMNSILKAMGAKPYAGAKKATKGAKVKGGRVRTSIFGGRK